MTEGTQALRHSGSHDEVMATGIKRRHELPRVVGDLSGAEIAEKKAPDQVSAHDRQAAAGQGP